LDICKLFVDINQPFYVDFKKCDFYKLQ